MTGEFLKEFLTKNLKKKIANLREFNKYEPAHLDTLCLGSYPEIEGSEYKNQVWLDDNEYIEIQYLNWNNKSSKNLFEDLENIPKIKLVGALRNIILIISILTTLIHDLDEVSDEDTNTICICKGREFPFKPIKNIDLVKKEDILEGYWIETNKERLLEFIEGIQEDTIEIEIVSDSEKTIKILGYIYISFEHYNYRPGYLANKEYQRLKKNREKNKI